ncbi:MAG TPA: hypothetical protein VN329_10715, partial [Roseomonas sp.]|nr:hypothetical protein [Roseomonas sp.]
AAGASFGMAMRILLDRSGARFTLRGCEAVEGAGDCGSYGTGAADALLVPLDRNGYGRRDFVVSRIPPAVAGNPQGLDPLVLRRETGGPRFHLLIEVARRPE